ncbi:MAG TPA: DUF6542 domain-containing protein [Candidatus Nanopelagicales bacterium]|nr:DUF6542 domain-containing protein [Candidatus Nanopelagicales bacterium]
MSEHEGPGIDQDRWDEEFAHLFRDDDPPAEPLPSSPPPPAIEEDWEPLVPVPTAGQDDPPLPPPAEPPATDQPAAPPPDPKEGRLFRSRGAPEVPEALVAVGSMQARRLRTLSRSPDVAPDPERDHAVNESPAPEAFPPAVALPVAASGEPAPALQVMSSPPPATTGRRGREERSSDPGRERDRRTPMGSGTLTGLGVYAVTIGVTIILAFGETLFFGGEPGVVTGIGLVIVSIFAAFAVRTSDAVNAIFAPPIAFFIAAITAGQVGISANDFSGRLVVLFFLLGASWVWIVGSTAAALVIVALRRRLG